MTSQNRSAVDLVWCRVRLIRLQANASNSIRAQTTKHGNKAETAAATLATSAQDVIRKLK